MYINLTNAKLRRAELQSLGDSVIQTMKDKFKNESIRAEKDTRSAENDTNYTLKVPAENAFLQAGLNATKKYYDNERQTKTANKDALRNHGSVANHVAREWMILCGKPETYRLFDETSRSHIKDILELATTPKDLQPIFLVAQTRMLKHGRTGIIQIRMASNYSHIEAQIVRVMWPN